MQIIKACFLSLLSVGLLCGAAFGQDVKPAVDGRCETGYFAYRHACISRQALQQKGNEGVAKSIEEFLASHPAPPLAKVCKTNVQELAGVMIKLENGAIVQKTSRIELGPVGFRAPALLVSQGSWWAVSLAGQVFPVKLVDEPWACDPPTSFPVQTSDGAGSYQIRGQPYDAGAACVAWARGDEVVFLTGGESKTCGPATLFNLTQPQSCPVTCSK